MKRLQLGAVVGVVFARRGALPRPRSPVVSRALTNALPLRRDEMCSSTGMEMGVASRFSHPGGWKRDQVPLPTAPSHSSQP
jgi:hypothetical protein